MLDILMYISLFLICVAFVGYFLIILLGNKKVTNSTGFDITKDIISEYNSINVIESKSYFTIYNIKRKVIKLSTKCYYGNRLSDISLSLIEAGVSALDNMKNRYIDIFRKVFSDLKILYIFPLITIFINSVTYTVADAKVSIVFVLFFSVVSYMLFDIKYNACFYISDNINKIKEINKDDCDRVIGFMNKILWLDRLIFFGELIMVLRFVLILLEIS